MDTLEARFKNRRDAELALEHLVQEIALDRSDVFIAADGEGNTSGTERSGADAVSSLSQPKGDKHPRLEGEIKMSVGCDNVDVGRISDALKACGACLIDSSPSADDRRS
jgi:hypothetical protein